MISNKKIGFIGAGAMAGALMTGVAGAKLVAPENIFASDPNRSQLEILKNNLGINQCGNNRELVEKSDLIVLAVKPSVVQDVLADIREAVRPEQTVVCIAAGITTSFLEALLPNGTTVVRVMSNTPALVGEGATAIALGRNAGPEQEALVQELFKSVGRVVTVKEELMDSVTGLSGSGPAYGYVILEALSDAGVQVGLPRDVSTMLAAQTLLGAAKMVLETGENPGRLKEKVTTPGGTTISGLFALEDGGVRAALIKAVVAATKRSQEMTR